MKISILCTDKKHPVFPFLKNWQQKNSKSQDISLMNFKNDLPGGDILFLISCNEIINEKIRNKYHKTLVVHASNLPYGRGWSPHVWQIIEGKNTVTVSLLEAEGSVDTGAIWHQKQFFLEGHELVNEINEKLFSAELELIDFAIENFNTIHPRPQPDCEVTYYPKRTPEDSKLDPFKTIAEQFNLLRVADPKRYPSFFDFKDHRYQVTVTKISKIDK